MINQHGNPSDTGRELSKSELFSILASRRRRLALRALQDAASPVAVGELASRLAEQDHETPTAENRRAIHYSLHHIHLPRLDEADVVVYTTEDETVSPGRHFDVCVRVLETVTGDRFPWSAE